MTLTTARVKFIVPKEATNLITNPSFEIDTTSYESVGASVTIARSTTYSRRGIASCAVTPIANIVSGVSYALALTSGTTYSFGADILDFGAATFNLFIASDTAGTLVSTNTSWTGTGYWKRRAVTYSATASATFYLNVTRSAVNSTAAFYTDGWQCESGIESTYLDGDMIGWIPGETAYRWNGTRHASTSWRSGQTRTGGTYVSLSTYARLLTIIGLGMTPITNVALPSTMGGSWYQNSVVNERPFSLLVNFNGNGDYATIQKARDAITECIRLDKTIYRQPMLIQYDELDGSSLEMAETLEIPCLYESGLEMTGEGDAWNEKAIMNFRMYMPLLRQQGERGQALGYQTTVANADFVMYRDTTGTWRSISTDFNDDIRALAQAPNGIIYIAGDFTNAGDANGDGIVSWNGTALASLGSGITATAIYALAVGPDGSVYVGGDFLNAGGVAEADYIAKWDGSTWTALSTGTGGAVYALAVGKNGTLYVGGNFTNLGDANGDYIVSWNGSAWSSLGTGMNQTVNSLTVGPDGSLYAGGNFTAAGGVSNTSRIAKWNGTAWVSIQTTQINQAVTALLFDPSGILYVGGNFTTADSGVANYIAKWDGNTWSPLGSGVSSQVNALAMTKDNTLCAGGGFTVAGGITLPSGFAFWNGSVWFASDVVLSFNTVYALLVDRAGNLFVSGNGQGTATSATVTVPNVGSAAVYPKIIFTGPGSLAQLKNYTTWKSIYFNLTLNAGEVATLNLDPANVSFNSTFRGNILNTILPGSNMNWELLSGYNNVSAYYYTGTSTASSIEMTWKDEYHSLDGALNANFERPVAELQSFGSYPKNRVKYEP